MTEQTDLKGERNFTLFYLVCHLQTLFLGPYFLGEQLVYSVNGTIQLSEFVLLPH